MRKKRINNELALLKIANFQCIILNMLICSHPRYFFNEIKEMIKSIECNILKPKALTEDEAFYPMFKDLMMKWEKLFYSNSINIVDERSKKRIRIKCMNRLIHLIRNTNLNKEALDKLIAKLRLKDALGYDIELLLKDIMIIKQKLIEDNRYLAVNIAQKFMAGEKIEDVTDIGVSGLVKAINLFEVERNIKFSTYAFYWIQVYIREELLQGTGNIKVPLYLLKKQRKIYMFYNKFIQENGREPTQVEVEKATGIPMKTQKDIEKANWLKTDSLDKQIGKQDSRTLGETIAFYDDDKYELNDALNKLDEVERDIIIFSFGLYNQPVILQKDLAEKHNITLKMVGKIKDRAIKKLRQILIT